MQNISNGIIQIAVAEKGAELQSVYHKQAQLEYLWSADPEYWAKKSPVLFPIVGGLKEGKYIYKGKEYKLGRHGFARDRQFELIDKKSHSLLFMLQSDEQTKAVYPFDFAFYVKYELSHDSRFAVTFTVENTGEEEMYFSVGAHPAFAVPLEKQLSLNDYYLQFSDEETSNVWPLSAEGFIQQESVPFFKVQNRLRLNKELFYKDALVFKDLKSRSIILKSDKGEHGLKMNFEGFPFMGIWSAKEADFVCIEPWCGIADGVNASGRLKEKEGIIRLAPDNSFECSYKIDLF